VTDSRVIAEIRGYHDFTDALRAWIAELGTTYESVNELAGLQDGYLAKLIAQTPIRSFSRISLGNTLEALGVKLLLVVDAERLATMKPRYTPSKHNAVSGMHSQRIAIKRPFSLFRGNPEMAKLVHARWMLQSSPRRRRQIARRAALIRWRAVRMG
jgi:hypothetical protein